jgi:hypothetical protein
MNLPPEHEAGTYATFAGIWHDRDGFILDFAVATHPMQAGADEDGNNFQVLPARVVSRIRIPYGQAWEFMKGLTTELGLYEQEFGITHGEPTDT